MRLANATKVHRKFGKSRDLQCAFPSNDSLRAMCVANRTRFPNHKTPPANSLESQHV